MANKSSVGIFGGKSQPKIIFFLQTETAPEMSYEISERELFRRLLSEKTAKEVGDAQQNETSNILKGIDLKSTISQVETHKSRNVGHIESENIFVVFQTTSSKENRQYWWSLEESTESVAMQRSQEKYVVINKFKGKIRNQVETIADGLKGKGSIKDFLILLWIHIVIDLKYQSFLSRCESFIPLVMKKITETFYEYPPNYFTYSALSSEEINPQVEEIINFLTKVTKWHPLLCLTYLGDIHQFDRVLGNGFFKTKIDGIYNRLTLLNAAILFCKTGMVKHVLEKKKANARKRDQAGRNALNMAALFTDEEEIIKLLLSFQIKDKLNIKDKSGMTSLHYAVISSNLTVARLLIDHGADFKRLDPTGHSPLHLAAHYAKDNQILELLLTKVNIDECDTAGITALHSAAIASNAISARYLIEKGADINRVDKRGRTPVHVAAALAKSMDFFNVFLSNEKADLECSDERKLTVLAYAKINQFGLAKEIVSGIEKKINDKRSEYSLAKKTAGVQPCTGGEYKHTSIFGNPMENITGGINVMGKYSQKFKSTRNLTGGEYKKTLLFVPDADNEPDVVHEISEPALFQFVLNEETLEEFKGAEVEIAKMLDVLKDIDKQSKITQVEAYHSSRKKMTDALKAYHVFIVFKSTSEKADDGVYWWSLEKHTEYIVLQRSRNKDNVKNKLHGKERIKVKSIKEDLKGKGTIKDLFAILWAHQVIPEKYNIFYSNCQFLVTFVGEQITEIGYKYKGNFKYYPPRESGREKQMLDLINILRGYSDWSPLFTLIPMGNTDLVDKTVASGKYDINASCKEMTPLHLAIKLNKTKMVQHLLQPPMNADPTKRDASGKSALLLAVDMYEMKEEIFDLLLAHDKVNVDDVDEDGQTALHLAARKSNIFQKLLERGANPNIFDKIGRSPLHVAALDRDGVPVIDLLLAHPKVKVDDVNEFGITALHAAAYASNVIAVKRLIEKGANPNLFDKDDLSPLHVAALQKNGNPMIDLLLEAQKVKGLGDVNNQNKQGRTALHYAAAYSNEITTEHLIEKGADLHCRTNVGDTPLHYAALGAKDMNIIDLLLENINEGEIEQYKNDERLFFFARHNSHGLEVEIIDRFRKKGIIPSSTETDDCWTGESDEATGVNTRRFVLDKGADPSVDLTGFDGLDFLITRVKISLGIYDDIIGRDQNCETLLFFAIRANNVIAVRRLLEKGADLTIRNNKGETPFHVAVENCRDFDILNLLLESGKVDINETSEYGETALHIAVMGSNTATAEFLLSKGANPNAADKGGHSRLHVAAAYAKDMDIVELLVNHKDVDVNLVDNYGLSALDYAKYNKHGLGERIVNLLKEKGAMEREDKLPKRNNESLKKLGIYTSSNAEDEIEKVLSDATVPIEDKIARIKQEHLISAIRDSDVERVRLLLKNGADISSARGEDGMNAFHVASKYAETTDLIDVILETGKFDINGVDNDGRTPLHWAIMGTNLETIAHHLIQQGADPTITDKEGNTALHFAASHAKTTDIVIVILANSLVDINYINTGGETALHKAIVAKNVEIVRFLVEKGADPTIHDHTGYTPFHFAAYFLTDTDVLGLLLETGIVDINETTSKQGLTALHLEIIKYNVPALRFLLSKGANPNVGDENGITPLHLVATLAKDIYIVELLLNHPDTNVNCLDNEGRNALDYANDNMHGHSERLTKLLKEKDVVSQTGNSLEDEKVQKEITFKNNVKGILAYAIENSDVEKVRILIEKGAEISTVTWGEEGVNALHVASVYAKKTELLDVILAAGQFEINGSNVNGMTALHYASHANNMTTARYLLEKGADPAIGDNKGFTPLHLAAKHSYNTDILALLLTREKKIEINKVNESGLTALYVAVATSNVTAARFLLEKGANPNVADPNGYIPLHVAAKYAKDMDIVELLLNHKDTNVNFLDNAGRNALDFAMDNEHGLGKAIVNLLREKMAAKAEGSKHELENIATSIPPSRIIKNSDIEKIRFLIENGQDVSAMTWGENGATALHLAAADEKAAEFIDVILETGKFDINGVDNDGRTPLHYAIERPDPVTINARRLIKMGANTSIADKNGVTPLHMAARNAESMDLIEILLNTEAVDVNCVDIKGRTPLSCARDNIHGLGQRIVHRLKEYGAMQYVSLSIKFEKDAILGMGAYGVIFKGEWNNLQVAVKRFELSECEAKCEVYKQEDALRELDHTNVVKLYHVESDLDFRYHVLELCQLSLHQLFQGNEEQKKYREKMPPEKEVCLQLAKGLAHIHVNRLIHRNIKPENVLIWVDYTGEKVVMKWSGFGLSKQVNERGSYSISGVRGTQNWMAPEILKIMTEENDRKTTTTTTSMPRRGTVKSDVFSAGLVFGYYLLDGDHPFGSPINVLPNIVKNKPVNLTKMKLHPMHAIIMEMLKDNPDERISSADVVSGLNNLIELQVSLSISIDRKKVLGKGAYGIVYEGTWKGRKVAVKRIQIENVQNNKEEEALQKLYHPNVVKLLHVESVSDFRYYALELCQASLDHKFLDETNPKKYRGLMPPEKEVCLQLAKGLAHIHDKGLIHRDIKPENVLIWVDYTGEKVFMKWSGFGLSKQVDERGSHSISGMRGTHNWMAPEILKIMTEENDRKTTKTPNIIRPRATVMSDVFSAGLVFGYYLLGGHHPFGSGYDILPNIVKNKPVNLTKIKEHPMVQAIIMDMLKDNPNERISSSAFR